MLIFFLNFLIFCEELINKKINYHSTLILNNIIIFNCIFFDINYNSHGGSIYISVIETNLYFDNNIFLKCRANGFSGGAIYCSSNKGNCNFNKLCSSNCSSYYGQFFEISQTTNSIKNFNLSTTEYCSNDLEIRYFAAYFIYGDQSVNYYNCSKNYNNGYVSSFEIRHSNSGSYKYCNILNGIGDATISIAGNSPKALIFYSNIINNSYLRSNGYGIIHSNVNTNIFNISNCILMKNSSPLFCSFSVTLIINNCNIDLYSSISLQPITINNIIINTIFNTLNLNLNECFQNKFTSKLIIKKIKTIFLLNLIFIK